ncbi:MAG: hypothetical protein ACR2KK_16780 [Acidimicrobiales bacterium]
MNVDRRAVVSGAKLAFLVAGAATVVGQVVKWLTGGDANLLLYVVVLGAWVAGGVVAGRRQPQSPLTHGSLAALLACLVLIVVLSVIDLARGNEVAHPVYVIFNALVAASMGIVGGYLGGARAGRPA